LVSFVAMIGGSLLTKKEDRTIIKAAWRK
jgi:hypothetical protein